MIFLYSWKFSQKRKQERFLPRVEMTETLRLLEVVEKIEQELVDVIKAHLAFLSSSLSDRTIDKS